MVFLRTLILGCLMVAMSGAAMPADDGRAWAPFVIPVEMSGESRIAFRGEPIAVDAPRVVARDGHFHVGDRRLRIWGVNLSYGANFPSHADAERVAARLEAFGINSVRFHHMDMEYFRFPQGIWDPAEPRKLSEEALDRLDYFIDQLARRGIYANLNLHVSRTHSVHLGLPDSKATGTYDKIVDLFTPELIEAQKMYARQLLTRVNTYRKVAYAKDPAVAFVEINNEDSFFMWDAEAKLRQMHAHYTAILRGRYNAWLKERYGTSEALAAAWAPPEDVELPSAMRLPVAGWKLSAFQTAAATVTPGEGAARIEVQKVGTAAWHLEFQRQGIALDREHRYELSFRAQSDAPRDVVATVRQGRPPYRTLGLRQTLKLKPEWQAFTLPFSPPENEADARVSLLFGQGAVAFEVSDVEVRPRPLVGLDAGEKLEAGTVAFLVDGESRGRLRDRMRFLAVTEKAYFDGFRGFIRSELDCDALVTGTIAFGFLGLWAQSDMDYIDAHTYWAHPQFPAGWSDTNWTIDQKAFVQSPEESRLFHDAATRLAGKPFTMSEYSHPAPSDYQAETVPLIATFAAAQDWDGVWLFGYADKHDDWDATAFDGFFNIQANPAKWGFVPVGAAIFRETGIEPLAFGYAWPLAADKKDPLADLVALHLKHDRSTMDGLNERWGIGRETALRQRVAVTLSGKPAALPAYEGSATSLELEGGRLKAVGRSAVVRMDAGGPGALARDGGFAVLAGAAMDGKPMAESGNVLLAVTGRCENEGMGFSGDRRTVRKQWGTGPVRIEALAATPRLPVQPGLSVIPLQADGTPNPTAPGDLSVGSGGAINLSPAYGTMWYALEAR